MPIEPAGRRGGRMPASDLQQLALAVAGDAGDADDLARRTVKLDVACTRATPSASAR